MFIATLLSGCSSENPPRSEGLTLESLIERARQAGATEAVEALVDGELTNAEFQSALDSMFSCFDEGGLDYVFEGVNPVDGWRPLYGVEDGPAAEGCRVRWLTYIELGWELLNPPTMDPGLMSIIQECLERRGETITGSERNLADLVPRGAEDMSRFNKVQACAESDREQFPTLVFTLE